MTNHPNRSAYNRLIAKLQRISVQEAVSPDIRRLAVDAYQRMIAAQEAPHRTLMSDASYRNLYGDLAERRMREDEAAIKVERRDAMEQAMRAAEQFLSAWDLN